MPAIDEKLARVLVVSQIVSLLAIPVVLAVIGFWVQRSLQEQQIKRDYVSLAVSLLLPKKENEKEASEDLKKWAVDLLNESSPVKLSVSQIKSISRDGLGLRPGDIIFFNSKVPGIYVGEGKFIHNRRDKVKVEDIGVKSE